jgi:putative heme degradation protein
MVTRLLLVWAMAVALLACGPKAIDVQARAASAMAVSVNGLVPILRDMEQKEGDAAIDRAPDKPTAKLWVKAIEDKWQSLWDAHKALQISQDAWAKALEQGGSPDAAYRAVEAAFCKLKPLLPKTIQLPPVAGVLCGGA